MCGMRPLTGPTRVCSSAHPLSVVPRVVSRPRPFPNAREASHADGRVQTPGVVTQTDEYPGRVQLDCRWWCTDSFSDIDDWTLSADGEASDALLATTDVSVPTATRATNRGRLKSLYR